MDPVFFASPAEFRKWLKENHATEKEILVGFHKVVTGKPSMTWSQSVDEAICFGWIDGIRKSINKDAYSIRFTPRKSKSIWSAVNMKKIEELTSKGLMHPAGISAYEKREERLRVCNEMIHLDLNLNLNRCELSSESSSSSSSSSLSPKRIQKSLILTTKEEDLSVGPDGKVMKHSTLP